MSEFRARMIEDFEDAWGVSRTTFVAFYASENRRLPTGVLRQDWGYDGLVVSDWGAVNQRDRALAAGLGLEMPSSGGIGTRAILDAVAAGTLSEAEVDPAVANVLALVARWQRREPLPSFDVEAHHAHLELSSSQTDLLAAVAA